MSKDPSDRSFEITWPLFGEATPFPVDPGQTVSSFAPPSSTLEKLGLETDLPESSEQAESEARHFRQSLPPTAPEWMRAARALADWLEQRILTGRVNALEQAAIARTWAAFSLGGSTQPEILRVANLVKRAHEAIRESPRRHVDVQAAIHACASVLYAGLPRRVKERMPLERALLVVRVMREQTDVWAAMVEGASELLGWKDYARIHAASVLRAAIESPH
jgi:hypothetical protein